MLILANRSAGIRAATPTEIMALIQQFSHDMQMQMAKLKIIQMILTFLCSSLRMLWLYTICTCQVFLPAHFQGSLVLPFSLCFFATLPISTLSGPNGSACLHCSFQFPTLIHPFILLLSLSQLALGFHPGGLFALEGHDGLHHFVHQCWGAAVGLHLCHAHFTQQLHSKWERTENMRMDIDRVYFLVSHIIIHGLFLVKGGPDTCMNKSCWPFFTFWLVWTSKEYIHLSNQEILLPLVIVSGRLIFLNTERIPLKNVNIDSQICLTLTNIQSKKNNFISLPSSKVGRGEYEQKSF